MPSYILAVVCLHLGKILLRPKCDNVANRTQRSTITPDGTNNNSNWTSRMQVQFKFSANHRKLESCLQEPPDLDLDLDLGSHVTV